VRSGPGEARTILLLHIISARPSKQPLMLHTFLKVCMELSSYFVSARTSKRNNHHLQIGREAARIEGGSVGVGEAGTGGTQGAVRALHCVRALQAL
jgi:hypothetical protein